LSRHSKDYTKKFVEYRSAIQKKLRKYRRGGKLFLRVDFYFRGPCEKDVDNLIMPVMNILQGVWFKNDRQIKKLVVNIHEYNRRYGLHIEVGMVH